MSWKLLATISMSIWAMKIAFHDWKFYRVSNRMLGLGCIFLYPLLFLANRNFAFEYQFLWISVGSIFLAFFRLIGMGDAKLIIVIAPWVDVIDVRLTLALIILVSWFLILLGIAIQGKIPTRIAFAPVILVAAGFNLAT